MRPFLTCFFFWLLSISLETTVSNAFSWFRPNLFFVAVVIFCLHWRGSETYFIAAFFGITADCFSTLPFGTFGLIYFVLSFFMRWYAIKMYYESYITLPVVVGIFTLSLNIMVFLLLSIFFPEDQSANWFRNVLVNEVASTAVVAAFVLKLLIAIEKTYKIRLAERKF